MHKQAWVKVNAHVDEEIGGVVKALSEFPSLETVESCKGTGWVCFRYGSYWEHPWRELADFVLGHLAPGLVATLGDDVNVRIQATASGQIFGELSIRPGAEQRVEIALRNLAHGVSVTRDHRSGYSGGMSDTSPPRC